jgi:hypothetical protein
MGRSFFIDDENLIAAEEYLQEIILTTEFELIRRVHLHLAIVIKCFEMISQRLFGAIPKGIVVLALQ